MTTDTRKMLPADTRFFVPVDGNFKLVTYDIMTTGSSLSDDLCSITAYSPVEDISFSQHIMPYNNLSLGACRRYSLRIISNGRYRVLKDVRNNRVLDTKSDYMALVDFISYLRCMKGDSEGLILLAHDSRKFFSSLLLDVVSRFQLREEFCELVVGFANSYAIAEEKCAKPGRSLSLRTLATSLLTKEGDDPLDLSDRAKTAYLLVAKIFQMENAESGTGDETLTPEQVSQKLRPYSLDMDGVELETDEIRNFRKREESLLPLFSKMRSNRNDRQRSFILLRLLAHSNIDYGILTEIHDKGGMEAIHEVLRCTMDKEHAREIDELKHVFALHFDPEYKGQFKPDPLPNSAGNGNGNGQKQQQGQGGGRRFFRRRNSNKKTSGSSVTSGRNNSESQPGSPISDDGATTPPVAISVPSATTAIAAV
ncbi:maternal protein exuperantia-2-like [Cloeon dipterum]|uniref:maternal protein exuperantia-2-like n=1 Tax=Cloeon dipterum TaxID=197152 RepID=UPI00321FDE95